MKTEKPTIANKKPQTSKEEELKQIVTKIPENITKRESQAERRRTLFKLHKGLFKKKESLVEFDEPILFLMRGSGKVEFYDKATGGKFTYTHSDGNERFILLDQRFLLSFDYAGKSFRGYICHEDFPLPVPEDPIVTTELVAIMFEKVLNDISKWKADLEKAKGMKIRSWAILLAVAGGIFLLWILLRPAIQSSPTLNETINQTINATINATKITIIG